MDDQSFLMNEDNLKHLDHYIWKYTNPQTGKVSRVFGDPYCWNKIYSLYGNPRCEILQLPGEFRLLLEQFIELKPKNILEIGNARGGTLYYWLKHSSENARVLGIDINHTQIESRAEWDVNLSKLHLYTGDSTSDDVVKYVYEFMPEIDFLFIDGNHKKASLDYKNYSTLCKKGIIALHDINHNKIAPETAELWVELKEKEFIWKEQCDHLPDDNGLGIGIIYRR